MKIYDDIEAVIFDLDGTLVDSMWMWEDIDVKYLERYGITFPHDLQDDIEGMSFTETAVYFKERFQLPATVDEIKAEWNEMAFYKYTNEVPLKEYVEEFLSFLSGNNIKLGIATSNSRELAEIVVEKLDIRKYFHSIRTSCEVEKGKPSPDIYLLVAEDLGVDPNKCLVFEDVIHGIMAGKSAGMEVCAIYDDFTKDVTDRKKEIADYYIDTYKDISMELYLREKEWN